MPETSHFSDRDWRNLLREIHSGQVIPVIGPGLVTVSSEGRQVPLHQYLPPQLAEALELDEPERFQGYNDTARPFLLKGGERKELYLALGELLDRLDAPPPQSLLNLAAITDFNLFVGCTPDPSLDRAVEQSRPGFSADRGVIRFHPAGNPDRSYDAPLSGNVLSPCNLPESFQGPLVYH